MKCNKVIVWASDRNGYDRLRISAWSARKFIPDAAQYLMTDSYFDSRVFCMSVASPSPALASVGFFPDAWSRWLQFASLFRLAIPLMKEFEKYDSVVYMDTDTLVKSAGANSALFDWEIPDAEEAAGFPRLTVGGRLGAYRYLDMGSTVRSALDVRIKDVDAEEDL